MTDFFARKPEDIVAEAIERFRPVRKFVGFSGGNDSRALAHWIMSNVPGFELFLIDTGIKVKQAVPSAIEFAERYGYPLTVIRAKEDCGQDYDEIVRKHGFPGPYSHKFMYRLLKERAVELLVRRSKTARMDKVLLVTGIREAESIKRMGYKDMEITRNGAQVWCNPIYWWSNAERDEYLMLNQVPRNPVSDLIGISGECLCGAYAHKGELAKVRSVDPDVADHIERLQAEVRDRFPWGWEGRPPTKCTDRPQVGMMCIGCEKSAVVQGLWREP